MARAVRLSACLIFLGLAPMLLTIPVSASDEDLSSSAYLVFDPETGEFVTVQDPNRTQQNHDARDPASASGPTTTAQTNSEGSPFAAGIAAAVALLGAVVWIQLKRRKDAQTDA
jgi:hypothetical protein